ncbi:IS481 family transposase [Allochromatium vinosum]|uniref:Integrase catalytic region n=1 Tax=Allochromatium vinosum (strain ATCC 17899 / DSM 180 / NBRC 103801 / NCIMB 10441 / D) TaxID=572477 RepID=D3RU71_ALLVD|nr:IS481 family transposase [Allochromatium vinosum]ADC62730.1 Integrase catalytic region [Allochromatium vinosum DSM 180]
MVICLHENARTTPAIRRELQSSTLSTRELAERYGLSRQTVLKWRRRSSTEDASHRPHRLHTRLTPAQEAVVVELRKALLLPLDDLLAVTHEFISPSVSRSGLDRCLRRHGVSNLQALRPQPIDQDARPIKRFKDYEPGFVHVDVKYLPRMPDEDSAQYLFAAIDRATRWVYVEILPEKTAQNAAGFLERLIAKAPFTITRVLTDNGKAFTDRFCATGEREPTGRHRFDQVCSANTIEHRLIQLRTPQTNGLIERFNGRISEVLTTSRFDSAESLAQTIERSVQVYNQHIPQKALGHIAPIQALKDWHEKRPELFKKRVYNLRGLDT